MKKFNWYFYQIWIPITILTAILFFTQDVNWWIVLLGWIVLGPVATGVGLHRLFGHRSFKTHIYIEWLLGYLATLSAYSPIIFWVAQHQYHHKHSDTEKDPTSPKEHGFWYSFLYWRFLKENLQKADFLNLCTKRIFRDKILMWLSNNFTKIIWFHIIVLYFINPSLLLSLYLLPILIESTRINLLNSFSHVDNIPLSYRNYNTNDKSYNNLIFGYLSLGFGWHNNHHYDPSKIIVHDRWWELDLEGYLAWLISVKK